MATESSFVIKLYSNGTYVFTIGIIFRRDVDEIGRFGIRKTSHRQRIRVINLLGLSRTEYCVRKCAHLKCQIQHRVSIMYIME